MNNPDYISAYFKALNEVGIGYSYPGEVEQLERRFLEYYLSNLDAPIVLDVGANVGNYTRAVKELSPSAKVFAFEPHPKVYETLKSTESLGGVTTYNIAIGQEDGRAIFYDIKGEESPLGSLHQGVIEQLHKKKSQEYQVQVRSLDSFFHETGIRRVNLLKVDTEGHELAVFQGARQALSAKQIDVVQFEFNDMNVITRAFFKDFVEILNDYRLFRLSKNGPIALVEYIPIFCEVFALQTIIGFRKDLPQNL